MEGEFDTMSSTRWLCDVMKTSMISSLSLSIPPRHFSWLLSILVNVHRSRAFISPKGPKHLHLLSHVSFLNSHLGPSVGTFVLRYRTFINEHWGTAAHFRSFRYPDKVHDRCGYSTIICDSISLVVPVEMCMDVLRVDVVELETTLGQ